MAVTRYQRSSLGFSAPLTSGISIEGHYVLCTLRDSCIFSSNKLCAWRQNLCLRPLQGDNIFAFIRKVAVRFRNNNNFVFIRQVAPVPACWLFKTSATS